MSSRLAADEPLPACSEAERLAANDFADQLRGSGREVEIETIWLRPAWWLVQAICSAAAVIASVVCVSSPTAGLAIAIIAAFFSLSDATRLAPLRRLTSKRASQNVISAPPARSPQPATMLILTAASDDRPVAANRFIPSSLIATNASCIALIAACAALRSAGIDILAVSAAQLIPTFLLLAAILVFLQRGDAEAVRDDSAREAVLEIAASLDSDPPEQLEVAVLLAGAGSAQAAGLRAWLRSRRKRGMRPTDVAILHVEPCSVGSPVWWERDGIVVATGLHPQLRRAAAAAERDEDLGATSVAGADATGAGVARGDGWPAIAIGSRAEQDEPQIAQPEDVSAVQAAVVKLGEALVRELDRELASTAQPDQ